MKKSANMIRKWVLNNELMNAIIKAITDNGLTVEVEKVGNVTWVWGTYGKESYYGQFLALFFKDKLDDIGLTLTTQWDMIFSDDGSWNRYHKVRNIEWQDIIDCITAI